jgi:hypothetical protein
MGDASSVRLAIAEETTFGTAEPSSAGIYKYLRFNNESLKLDINQIQSAEIDPTRQPAGAIRVGVNASGDITSEDSLVTPAASSPINTLTGFDPLIEGACMSDFATIANNVGVSLTIGTPAGGVFTLAGTGALTNVAIADWIKITGMAQGTMYVHILTRADANNGTAEGVLASTGAPVVAGGPTSATLTGSTVHTGTTKKSYTIERAYSDLTTPEYSLYTGMRVARWGLRLNSNAIFEHSFGFLGKLQATSTSTAVGAPTAKWTTTRLQAVDHFKQKMVGAFTTTAETGFGGLVRVESIDFTLDNALRTEPELGFSGSRDIGIGTPKLDGSVVMYMTNADLVRIAEAGTYSKLAFRLDDATRARIISINNILFGTPDIGAKGNNDSVRVSLPFSAESDSAGFALTVSRF